MSDALAPLVRAAQGGDRGAFDALYRRFGRMVHGILLAHGPREEAEDLVQEVFVKAWSRLADLREPAAFGAWLARMARHRATDALRGRRDSQPIDPALPAADSTHAEALAVMQIVRTLPEAYRETLVLRLVEGLSGPEIAELTGLSPGSVRVNLHRGVALLRERLSGATRGA
jgi:RNA polymerase sigma-70 factor (ECF subfamily)